MKPFIPIVASGNVWRVKFATGGNFGFLTDADAGLYYIYTRERTLLEVAVFDVPSEEIEVTPITDAGVILTALAVTYTTGAIEQDDYSRVTIDLSDFIRAGYGKFKVEYVEANTIEYICGFGALPNGHTIANTDALRLVDGVAPWNTIAGAPFCGATTDNCWFEPLRIYGRIPDMIYEGGVYEIQVPFFPLGNFDADSGEFDAASVDGANLQNLSYIGRVKSILGGTETQRNITSEPAQQFAVPSGGMVELYKRIFTSWQNEEATPQGNDLVLQQSVKIRKRECGKEYARLYWTSRAGTELESWWEVVKKTDTPQDAIFLQTGTDYYAGTRGYERSFVLRLDQLTPFDYWYYASVMQSRKVHMEADGFNIDGEAYYEEVVVTPKALTVPDDESKFYDLEIEVKMNHYDAY